MLILSLLAFATAAHADVILLDCNVEGGDQQVRVSDGALGLELQELTSKGSWKTRSLSAKEWESKNIRLQSGPGETYVLYFQDKAWLYQSVGSGFRQSGFADCN